jgi:hypothetical protein
LLTAHLAQKRSYESEYNVRDLEMRAQISMDRVKRIVRNAGLGCEGSFLEGDWFERCDASLDPPHLQNAYTLKTVTTGPDELTVVTAWPLQASTRVVGMVPDGQWCQTLDACYTSTRVEVEDATMFDLDNGRYVYMPTLENTFRKIDGIEKIGGADILIFASPVRALNDRPVYPVSEYTIKLVDRDACVWNCRKTLCIDPCGSPGNEDCLGEVVDACVDDLRFELLGANTVRLWMLFRSEKPDRGFADARTHIQVAGNAFPLYQHDAGHYHRRLLVETVLVRNRNL